MDVDVAIIGAGPAGLCLAKALADIGLQVVLIERQSEAALADPAFDGREIALTHDSVDTLRQLGIWQRIDAHAISPLKDAKVFNGASLFSMNIHHQDVQRAELGYLLANHLIRRAAYQAVKSSSNILLQCDAEVADIATGKQGARIALTNQTEIRARLLVGADSRFSSTRRAMGIAADVHDFGKTMMVCVMEHELPHHHAAWEWFDYGQTLALLPMNGSLSSVVVTLPPAEIEALLQLDAEEFSLVMAARFKHRLGAMRLVSTRHAYPLVTAYAKRMVGQRFALIGDAAVGMHPVTAHGFNFGLKSVSALTAEISQAQSAGLDIGKHDLLSRYEHIHRLQTRPLFLATHAVAKLYSADTLPARLLRNGAIRLGHRVAPFKRLVAGFLAGTS